MPENILIRRRYSIFLVLSLLLVGLVVVPLVSFAWRALSSSRVYIEDSLRERQLLTALPAATFVQTLMDERGNRLNSLVTSFEVFAADQDFQTYYEGLLTRDILSRVKGEDTLLVQYLDVRGNRFSATGDGLSQEERTELEAAVVPFARQALQENRRINSGVFFVHAGALRNLSVPAMSWSVPLHAGQKTVAVISGVFILQSIQEQLIQFSREFGLFVTDSKGSQVFHSLASYQGKPNDLSTDPMVSRVLAGGNIPTSSQSYSVTLGGEDGEEVMVTCAPIPEYNWLLFSYVSKESFFAPIKELKKNSTIWIISAIVVALLVGLGFARAITKPLSDLTEVSNDLAQGNFGRRAEVKLKNEIGELATAFNLMADEIQDYIRRVEAGAEENSQLFLNSIRAIANAIDAKDPYTHGHSERVSAYAMIVAREHGFKDTMLRNLYVSSLLHDVGKIGIEDKILRKPGALTNEEFAVMKTHPGKGADILGSIPQMGPMIPGIKHHHERWAGGGYPDGLVGDKVPLLARIIGVADAFDAMTTNRPYQRAMTFESAAARINELCPSVYEPTVVEAFNRALRSGAFVKYQVRSRDSKLA